MTALRVPATLLWALSFANFAVGMGAFVVIGVLSPVATDLGITSAEAGSLLTVYAVVYALTSPLLMAATGGLDRAWALAAGMGVFSLGALAASQSSGLIGVLGARCIMAAGAGIVTPGAATVAVATSRPEARGRALAIVFGGLTLAQALGVPLGAWLGYAYGWRSAFAVVAGLGAVATGVFIATLPRRLVVPAATLASLRVVLTSLRQTVAVSFTALFMGAVYVPFTFLAAFVESRYQLGRIGVTGILVLVGVGAVLGNSAGGALTDRIGSQRTLVGLCGAQLLVLPLVMGVPMRLEVLCVLLGFWSVCTWAFMVPQQARLAQIAPDRVPVLFALNASAIYVGGSLGSAVGGITLHAAGFSPLGAVGASAMLIALVSLFYRPKR